MCVGEIGVLKSVIKFRMLIRSTIFEFLYKPGGNYMFKVNNRNTRVRCENKKENILVPVKNRRP